jgi:hypothetical protein
MPLRGATRTKLQCCFGAAPGTLRVMPASRGMAASVPAATIQDHIPPADIQRSGCAQL